MSTSADEVLNEVPGAQHLFDWFGYWPTFHDAEVLSVEFQRSEPSKIRVHTWETTKEVDAKGYFVCRKHCVVTFSLENLTKVDVQHFNNQSALSDLEFYKDGYEFVLYFHPGHGLQGSIRAERVAIELQAGIPSDSQYQDTTS